MRSRIQSIAIDRLVAHPGNPNRMSKVSFSKLVRNIKRTGRYEPLVVRPSREKENSFEIINGHHRWKALRELGQKEVDVIVWDVDEEETDILLATLNRLGGSDVLDKQLALLRRLSGQMAASELGGLLPQTARQIERLTKLRMPSAPAKMAAGYFASPMVFFVNDEQERVIEEALSAAQKNGNEKTRAGRRAGALTKIARAFVD